MSCYDRRVVGLGVALTALILLAVDWRGATDPGRPSLSNGFVGLQRQQLVGAQVHSPNGAVFTPSMSTSSGISQQQHQPLATTALDPSTVAPSPASSSTSFEPSKATMVTSRTKLNGAKDLPFDLSSFTFSSTTTDMPGVRLVPSPITSRLRDPLTWPPLKPEDFTGSGDGKDSLRQLLFLDHDSWCDENAISISQQLAAEEDPTGQARKTASTRVEDRSIPIFPSLFKRFQSQSLFIIGLEPPKASVQKAMEKVLLQMNHSSKLPLPQPFARSQGSDGETGLKVGRWHRFWVVPLPGDQSQGSASPGSTAQPSNDTERKPTSSATVRALGSLQLLGMSAFPRHQCMNGDMLQVSIESHDAKVAVEHIYDLGNGLHEVHFFLRRPGKYNVCVDLVRAATHFSANDFANSRFDISTLGKPLLPEEIPLPYLPLNYSDTRRTYYVYRDTRGNQIDLNLYCPMQRFKVKNKKRIGLFEFFSCFGGYHSAFTAIGTALTPPIGEKAVLCSQVTDQFVRSLMFRRGAWVRLPCGCDGVHCVGDLLKMSPGNHGRWLWASDLCTLELFQPEPYFNFSQGAPNQQKSNPAPSPPPQNRLVWNSKYTPGGLHSSCLKPDSRVGSLPTTTTAKTNENISASSQHPRRRRFLDPSVLGGEWMLAWGDSTLNQPMLNFQEYILQTPTKAMTIRLPANATSFRTSGQPLMKKDLPPDVPLMSFERIHGDAKDDASVSVPVAVPFFMEERFNVMKFGMELWGSAPLMNPPPGPGLSQSAAASATTTSAASAAGSLQTASKEWLVKAFTPSEYGWRHFDVVAIPPRTTSTSDADPANPDDRLSPLRLTFAWGGCTDQQLNYCGLSRDAPTGFNNKERFWKIATEGIMKEADSPSSSLPATTTDYGYSLRKQLGHLPSQREGKRSKEANIPIRPTVILLNHYFWAQPRFQETVFFEHLNETMRNVVFPAVKQIEAAIGKPPVLIWLTPTARLHTSENERKRNGFPPDFLLDRHLSLILEAFLVAYFPKVFIISRQTMTAAMRFGDVFCNYDLHYGYSKGLCASKLLAYSAERDTVADDMLPVLWGNLMASLKYSM